MQICIKALPQWANVACTDPSETAVAALYFCPYNWLQLATRTFNLFSPFFLFTPDFYWQNLNFFLLTIPYKSASLHRTPIFCPLALKCWILQRKPYNLPGTSEHVLQDCNILIMTLEKTSIRGSFVNTVKQQRRNFVKSLSQIKLGKKVPSINLECKMLT